LTTIGKKRSLAQSGEAEMRHFEQQYAGSRLPYAPPMLSGILLLKNSRGFSEVCRESPIRDKVTRVRWNLQRQP